MGKINETFVNVYKVLEDIYNLNFSNPCCNERYLHHYFSQKIKETYPVLCEDYIKSTLHPEWATASKSRLTGGKYRNIANEYSCCDKTGKSGLIDFAIGNYDEPELGLEFKVFTTWKSNSLISDYMKLMDEHNRIKSSISFVLIFRKDRLSNRLNSERVCMLLKQIENRLDGRLKEDRKFLFWIVEIAIKQKEKRSWYCNNLKKGFLKGVPNIS